MRNRRWGRDGRRHQRRCPRAGVDNARHYIQRVYRLALWYVGFFPCGLIGIGLLTWKAQFFVGLTKRSNIETLTPAFLFVFFAYIALLSARGVLGAAQFGAVRLARRLEGHLGSD